ncbi:hypothetical protein H072_10101 [Dactylellina haptotyla CBS 200.50]|uniref:Uncharacterized protein n=1 Tax=Dactylellina haptotyla (strain CBS 200.50) TaxID=1284197 RepID=S8A5L5_DACHA|nr:hypothetical protein H072_10101 [Dactylellina haptotyla CBS 200.50]
MEARRQARYMVLSWLLFYTSRCLANIDAAAEIKIIQANETGLLGDFNTGDENPHFEERLLSSGLGFTSFLTVLDIVTTPTETITAFNGGNDQLDARITSGTTAATSPTPTGSCSLPPEVDTLCIVNRNGPCLRAAYKALQGCYQTGTFTTATNVAQYFIECKDQLGPSGCYNGFRDCLLKSLENQLNSTSTKGLSRRSLTKLGGMMVANDHQQDGIIETVSWNEI